MAASLALALVAGSGIALVSTASPASAHSSEHTVTCSTLTVKTWSYPAANNTLTVWIDNKAPVVSDFSGGTQANPDLHHFSLGDSTVNHTWRYVIDAPGTQYDKDISGTTVGCQTPKITVDATVCTAIGGDTDLTASFTSLEASQQYTVTVSKNGAAVPALTKTIPGTTSSSTWADLQTGATYRVTITNTANSALTASAEKAVLGCPQQPVVGIAVTECVAFDQAGSVTVTASGLVSGRSYVATVFIAGTNTPVATSATFSGDGAGNWTSGAFPVPTGASYQARVVDTAAATAFGTSVETSQLIPCPMQQIMLVEASPCTAVEGTGGVAKIDVSSLVPGRAYTVTVTRDRVNVFTQVIPASNNSSVLPQISIPNLVAGNYLVNIVDNLVPSYAAESAFVMADCPTQPGVRLTTTECVAPVGTSSVDATGTGLSIGRSYTVTLTSAGLPVAGYPAVTFSATAASSTPFSYTGLTAGTEYRVKIVDTALPTIMDVEDVTLDECPGTPIIKLDVAECSVLFNDSTIEVDLSDLETDETYTVTIVDTLTNQPIPGVVAQTVTGTTTASVLFESIPNNKDYTITVENESKVLSAVATIFLTICEPPTLSLPELPTMALSGSSAAGPLAAGMLLLQLGLLLVGLRFVTARRARMVNAS